MVKEKIKESALGTGQKAVRLLKLFVLAFWVGGGLVAGLIVPFSMQRKFADDAKAAADIVGAVLTWFSWAQVGLGALTLALMLAVDRGRRVSTGVFIALLILVGTNLLVIQSFVRSESSASWAHNAYVIIFFGGWVVALVHFLVTAAATASYRPLPARPLSPAPNPSPAPSSEPAGDSGD